MIDEIGDPLVHLLRNAIDHGIETPEIRRKAGKPESGTITLTAYHSGNHVYIEIRDDGAGIKIQNILHQAISKGIISESESEQLTNEQVYELIMASGFSTADTITDISGRGVGYGRRKDQRLNPSEGQFLSILQKGKVPPFPFNFL